MNMRGICVIDFLVWLINSTRINVSTHRECPIEQISLRTLLISFHLFPLLLSFFHSFLIIFSTLNNLIKESIISSAPVNSFLFRPLNSSLMPLLELRIRNFLILIFLPVIYSYNFISNFIFGILYYISSLKWINRSVIDLHVSYLKIVIFSPEFLILFEL